MKPLIDHVNHIYSEHALSNNAVLQVIKNLPRNRKLGTRLPAQCMQLDSLLIVVGKEKR